jgi:hypothetical protein
MTDAEASERRLAASHWSPSAAYSISMPTFASRKRAEPQKITAVSTVASMHVCTASHGSDQSRCRTQVTPPRRKSARNGQYPATGARNDEGCP